MNVIVFIYLFLFGVSSTLTSMRPDEDEAFKSHIASIYSAENLRGKYQYSNKVYPLQRTCFWHDGNTVYALSDQELEKPEKEINFDYINSLKEPQKKIVFCLTTDMRSPEYGIFQFGWSRDWSKLVISTWPKDRDKQKLLPKRFFIYDLENEKLVVKNQMFAQLDQAGIEHFTGITVSEDGKRIIVLGYKEEASLDPEQLLVALLDCEKDSMTLFSPLEWHFDSFPYFYKDESLFAVASFKINYQEGKQERLFSFYDSAKEEMCSPQEGSALKKQKLL